MLKKLTLSELAMTACINNVARAKRIVHMNQRARVSAYASNWTPPDQVQAIERALIESLAGLRQAKKRLRDERRLQGE